MKSFIACVVLAMFCGATVQAGNFGIGAHYWTSVEDIEIDDIDDSGLSWVVSYQIPINALLVFETDLEIFTDDFAGITDTVYAPQAFLLAGHTVYGGVGVGINYADGEFFDDEFYTIRLGLDMQITPGLALDINANYVFQDWGNFDDTLDDIDGDTITLGVALRFGGK